MTSKYTDIIARLEKAKGADGKIDWMIRDLVEGYEKTEGDYDSSGFRVWAWKDGKCFEIDHRCTAYTASIDASIVLVERVLPEANCYGFDKDPGGFTAYVSRNNVPSGHWIKEALAPTAPIAILLALFRAMEAKEATP